MHLATASTADAAKTRLEDGKLLRWSLDALFKRRYPQDVLDDLGADAPHTEAVDAAAINPAAGLLGINCCARAVISADAPWDVHSSGREVTDMG